MADPRYFASVVRNIITYCSIAFASLLLSPIAFATAAPLEVVRLVAGLGGHEHTAASFKAELSLMAQAEAEETAVRSDLRREGHGFRMCRAEEYEGLAPA